MSVDAFFDTFLKDEAEYGYPVHSEEVLKSTEIKQEPSQKGQGSIKRKMTQRIVIKPSLLIEPSEDDIVLTPVEDKESEAQTTDKIQSEPVPSDQ